MYDFSKFPVYGYVGEIRNDTVVGDPLFTVPLRMNNVPRDLSEVYGNKMSLCYEVKGESHRYFNLISDECTSVNAYYGSGRVDSVNVITKIGIVARDSANSVSRVSVGLDGCRTHIDGAEVQERWGGQGISVLRRENRVRVSVPNCDSLELVMWVVCEQRQGQPMIKFVVARGHNLSPTSHGLIGEL